MSKTTIRKGKQDDKYCLAIREIQNSNPDNKKCLDCEQRGPTYINITIGSFICTKCSGMLRGINPPHRIKSISMSSFTPEEVEMMKSRGNTWCAQVWLGTYNKAQKPIDFKDEEKIRDFIIEKYEKKRYYVDPSQISKPKASASSGSFQSAVPETRPLSQLIGTSLKSSLANSSQGNISISRPGGGPPPVIKPPSSDKALSVEPSPSILGTTSSSSTSLTASSNAAVSSTPDAFANFANFDTAAFDSMPPDPLGPPASSSALPTLPPTKKISPPSAPTSSVTAQQPETKVISASDRYAALKDLDDLFRCTTIDSPVSQPTNLFETPPAPIPTTNNFFPNDTFGNGSPSVPNLFSKDPMGNGSSFGNGNSYGRSSPSYFGQQPPQQQQQQQPWQPHWEKPISSVPPTFMDGNGGWPMEGNTTQWRGGVHPTNPFGTSPSGPAPFPSQLQPSDNNNDLFAAAPKPFLHEKSAVVDTNPWMTSVPTFASSMTPAPNPNNPFL